MNILLKAVLEFLGNEYEVIEDYKEENTKITHYTSYHIKVNFEKGFRLVHFILSVYDTHKRVTLKIENTDGEGHNFLPLDKYLIRFCGVHNSDKILLIDQYPGGTLLEKITSFFNELRERLDSKFFAILNGNDWVEIPFEWGSYK